MMSFWAGVDRVGFVSCYAVWRWGLCLAKVAIRIRPSPLFPPTAVRQPVDQESLYT